MGQSEQLGGLQLTMSADRFVAMMLEQFGSQLPVGWVEAEVTNEGVWLRIGQRYVHFNTRGRVIAEGETDGNAQ